MDKIQALSLNPSKPSIAMTGSCLTVAGWCTDELPAHGTGGNVRLVGTVGALEGLIDEVGILLDDHSEMWRQYQGLPMNRRHSHSD